MSTALKAFSTAPFSIRIPSMPTAKFTVCRMGDTEDEELREAHTERSFNRRTRKEEEKLDVKSFLSAKVKKQILGWDNLALQRETIPFSEENLENLFEFNRSLVLEVLAEANAIDPVLAEEREKNSSAGENGPSTE